MFETFATDIDLWRAAAWVTGLLAFGGWAIALGGTADMVDGNGRKIGFPLGDLRYWRYLGIIFSADFYSRQKPSRRWSIRLARFSFWMQLLWIAVMVRLALLSGGSAG